MPNAEPAHRADDPNEWLSPILWPDGRTRLVVDSTGGAAGRGHRDGPVWWASPTAEAPHILIPTASGPARRAVRRYHDGFTPTRRLRSLTAEAAMILPPVAALALRGQRVVTRSEPGAERGVVEWLAELLEVPDLVVAVTLSVPKSNRKPVLQLLHRSGRCLGWAKVGWSPISEALVANEARWLDRPAVPPLATPRLLHDVELCGRRVVVTSAVEAARRPRRRPGSPPAPEIFRAVASRGHLARQPVASTPWWRSVEEVVEHADDEERAVITAVGRALSAVRVEVGAWHGDLTPWNLMTSRHGVQLIDWELAADGVPVGFDLCHFHTQVAAEMKGAGPAAALDRSARLSPGGLAAIGVDPATRPAVWRLYLIELIRRSIALRSAGYPAERLTHGQAALARLRAPARPTIPTRSGPATGPRASNDLQEVAR